MNSTFISIKDNIIIQYGTTFLFFFIEINYTNTIFITIIVGSGCTAISYILIILPKIIFMNCFSMDFIVHKIY
jgi:hypothetical protein